ncbi:hypothetical protein ACR3EC_09740, partial [Corynebacterium diphtheriae]
MSRATLGIRSSWVGFVAAATTAMASTIAPVAHAQVAHHVPHDGCSAVEVAVVGGTTQANIHDDPHDVYSFGKGTNFAVNMTRRFHNVTAWQLPYYSSAGITASNNDAEQKEFPPYAVSKNRGVDALDAHLSDQAVKGGFNWLSQHPEHGGVRRWLPRTGVRRPVICRWGCGVSGVRIG